MTALGLKGKEIDPYYSFDIEKGSVYFYERGQYKEGESVNYGLSRGPYSLDEDDYIGMDEDEARDYVDGLNEKNARISLSFKEDYSSTRKGRIYKCTNSTEDYYHYVKCYISLGEKKPEPQILCNDPNAKNYGSTTESCVYEQSQPDPQPDPQPEPQPQVLCNDPNAENYGSTTQQCIYPAIETAYVPPMNIFESLIYSSAEEAENALRSTTFAPFTNVTYIKTRTRDYLVGSIYQIEVNGNSGYEPGQYEVNTPITVYISQGY